MRAEDIRRNRQALEDREAFLARTGSNVHIDACNGERCPCYIAGRTQRRADELIAQLAPPDPRYLGADGRAFCWFCGAFADPAADGYIAHGSHCVWVEAQRALGRPIRRPDSTR